MQLVDNEGVGVSGIAKPAPIVVSFAPVRMVEREFGMLVGYHLGIVGRPEPGGERNAEERERAQHQERDGDAS